MRRLRVCRRDCRARLSVRARLGIRLSPELKSIDRAIEFVEACLPPHIDGRRRDEIGLLVFEVVSSALEHGLLGIDKRWLYARGIRFHTAACATAHTTAHMTAYTLPCALPSTSPCRTPRLASATTSFTSASYPTTSDIDATPRSAYSACHHEPRHTACVPPTLFKLATPPPKCLKLSLSLYQRHLELGLRYPARFFYGAKRIRGSITLGGRGSRILQHFGVKLSRNFCKLSYRTSRKYSRMISHHSPKLLTRERILLPL